ncbi:MAG: hypothetical protein V4734_10160 [Terriglobus sp.]
MEYALIAALIGAVCVTTLSGLATAIKTALGNVSTTLTGGAAGSGS